MRSVRRTATFTALLLGSALLAPTGASAVGDICRGEAATIVGTYSATVVGTDGRDVIVTSGAMAVDAGAGDDLICVTGARTSATSWTILIEAGAGNDVVDGTGAPGTSVLGTLGAGSDEFLGGHHNDAIATGALPGIDGQVDGERDVVVSGAGDDTVATGQNEQPNEDLVDLGVGDDRVAWFGESTAAAVHVTAGDGRDQLTLRPTPGDWSIRNPSGQAWHDGLPVTRWSSVERFYLDRTDHTSGPLSYFGTHEGDEVEVYATRPEIVTGRLMVAFGSGDDTLKIPALSATHNLFAGHDGTNTLVVGTTQPALWFDMRDDRLDIGDTRGTEHEADVYRFGDVHVLARKVAVRGTEGDDTIRTTSCRSRVWGDVGNDVIERAYDRHSETTQFDCTERAWFRGDKGRDRLRGSLGPDVLVGGGGRDRAEGRAGRDRCQAEIERTCER